MKNITVEMKSKRLREDWEDKTESVGLSVCAWDWCGARARGLINSLHKAPPVDVT